MFGILILVVLAVSEIFHQREIKKLRQINAEEFTAFFDEKMKLREQYHTIEVRLEEEIEALSTAVDHFKSQRDPDSMFPSMEGSIPEANAVANLRLLQKLYKELFPPQ